MAEQVSGLEDLESLRKLRNTVFCRGEAFVIEEFDFEQALELIPILKMFAFSPDDIAAMRGEPDAEGNVELNVDVASIVNSHREAVFAVVAVAIRRDVKFVRRMPGSVSMDIVSLIIEQNADFLLRHALPLVLGVAKEMGFPMADGTKSSMTSELPV